MAEQKILTILRHAKAEAGSAVLDDLDRSLNAQGLAAATAMGHFMARHHMAFDRVLCSTAKRARQTLDQLMFDPMPPVDYSEKLYLASAGEMLPIVASAPEAAHELLLIGHNPGLQQLCLKLARKGDEDRIDTMAIDFPTCALASIAVGKTWKEALDSGGELLEFLTPELLAGQDRD